ncbi:DNA-binding transcriptional regulator, ArsR family [Mycobacterium terramassiliense]|uniref:DNA-binding transcriptional regulator, ArsR family n=1 Tax=Mycobacterium terramassiliense TaxID=1841859 RepID=A0A2U3N6T6_9MYCO|nr:DNA-binding transcriptional regulator, ArsR family [Mycobacterium terramassiliense]
MDAAQAVDLAAMFKALADPVRLRLLSLTASHPLAAGVAHIKTSVSQQS